MPLLRAVAVTATRGPTPALRGVDLEVHPGEVVGLCGPSGCGKSTFLQLCAGFGARTGGVLTVLGRDPGRLLGAALRTHRREAQLLLQSADAALNPGLRVREAVRDVARLHGRAAADADDALAQVDLSDRADARPAELSGGEKRRVALAMLALARPRLVLADEPTAGLDAARRLAFLSALRGVPAPGGAVLLVSHDLPLLLAACTRLVVMDEGRTVDALRPSDAADAARHPTTARLLDAAGVRG